MMNIVMTYFSRDISIKSSTVDQASKVTSLQNKMR